VTETRPSDVAAAKALSDPKVKIDFKKLPLFKGKKTNFELLTLSQMNR